LREHIERLKTSTRNLEKRVSLPGSGVGLRESYYVLLLVGSPLPADPAHFRSATNLSHPGGTVVSVNDAQPVTLLRSLTENAEAVFRPGQAEAIEAVTRPGGRALVVQRTGWGKSAVYFIATRMLRANGAGPTVIVSPLLALMRNQIEAADRLGLVAVSVNSTNRDVWEEVFASIAIDEIDLLLISPERLNNPQFREDVLPRLLTEMGLLVIDEVHCISDWGHDFRPDYRRLKDVVASLPKATSVLGTTATANDRVIADVEEQLGSDLALVRGTLDRPSLALQVIDMPGKAERMAWVAATVPSLEGSGIVYALTIADARRLAAFLRTRGIDAEAYTGQTDADLREKIENRLSRNALKVVVATSALAMGYDNPHIQFVIHFQVPGSPIAYYQQVGRAGRAVDRAYGVALSGIEDARIQDYFIDTAFPSERVTDLILGSLEDADGLTVNALLASVNMMTTRMTATLKVLEVEGVVYRDGSLWYRSDLPWEYPRERIEEVTRQRKAEQRAMAGYVTTGSCLMAFLRNELDDPSEPCGRCVNCLGELLDVAAGQDLVPAADAFLGSQSILIEPRKQPPAGLKGLTLRKQRLEPGRALARYGESGLGARIERGRLRRRFDAGLVAESARLLGRSAPEPSPTWVTSVPNRDSEAITEFARKLADRLGLDYIDSVVRVSDNARQDEMNNSYQQAINVLRAFAVSHTRPGPVLLVDDLIDSNWTMSVIGNLLIQHGSGAVFPFALAYSGNA
jgi:ATP-dependent DNA helicase RecQ